MYEDQHGFRADVTIVKETDGDLAQHLPHLPRRLVAVSRVQCLKSRHLFRLLVDFDLRITNWE